MVLQGHAAVIYRRLAGSLLFIGPIQFLVAMLVAEAISPGYSISENVISDLGVGVAAPLFNSSVFILGITILVGALLILRISNRPVVSSLFVLTGSGAMGVGLFPETAGVLHAASSLMAFLFGGLAALATYGILKKPIAHFSVESGIISLVALALFASNIFFGLGRGGMERMIVYPLLAWEITLGAILLGLPSFLTIPNRT